MVWVTVRARAGVRVRASIFRISWIGIVRVRIGIGSNHFLQNVHELVRVTSKDRLRDRSIDSGQVRASVCVTLMVSVMLWLALALWLGYLVQHPNRLLRIRHNPIPYLRRQAPRPLRVFSVLCCHDEHLD